MPRWAEMVALLVVGGLLVGGFVLWARLRADAQRVGLENGRAVTERALNEPLVVGGQIEAESASAMPTGSPDVSGESVNAEPRVAVADPRPKAAAGAPNVGDATAGVGQPGDGAIGDRGAGDTQGGEAKTVDATVATAEPTTLPVPERIAPALAKASEPGGSDLGEAAPAGVPAPEIVEGVPAPPDPDAAMDNLPSGVPAGAAKPGKPEAKGAAKSTDSEGGAATGSPGHRRPPKPVPRGSREELVLLMKSERALKQLHMLRLREGITPAAVAQQRARLDYFVAQLPVETRTEMKAWIAQGNKALEARIKPVAPDQAAAQAQDVSAREVGKADDRPAAEKQLERRIEKLRGAIGTDPKMRLPRRPTAPPAVNPTTLPVAPTPAGGSGLPSASSHGLDN